MVLLILGVILFGLICLNLKLIKHVSAPPIVLGVVFLASYMMIGFVYNGYESNDWFYACYIFAFISFSYGFLIQITGKKISTSPVKMKLYFDPRAFWIIWKVEAVFSISQIAKIINLTKGSVYDIWSSARANYKTSSIVDFLFLFEIIFFFVNTGVFLVNRIKQNRNRMILSAIPLIPCLITSHRGVWFMIIITILFMVLFVYKPSNIKVIKLSTASAAAIIMVVVISSFWKYGKWYSNSMELMRFVLNGYFSSQFVAFKQYMENPHDLMMGQNTFRFFIAVFNSVGLAPKPIDVVQPFVSIYGYLTNVYTVLQYYAADFGMWWAYFIEFILGCIYGMLYQKIFNKTKFNLYCLISLSMLMYPLINQFFDDKYFSILSEWIKYFMVLILLTQKCFVKSQGEKNEERA